MTIETAVCGSIGEKRKVSAFFSLVYERHILHWEINTDFGTLRQNLLIS